HTRQIELKRTFPRVGHYGHRGGGERTLQRRVRIMRNRFEDVDGRHWRVCEYGQEEPEHHDWFAPNFIGEPAKENEEWRADCERERNHDLRRRSIHREGLS